MQLLQWLRFFAVLAAARGASVFRGEIPVKVVYDEEVTHRLYVRNLDKTAREEAPKAYENALKNHDEKPQLSEEELAEATRYLPGNVKEEVKKTRIVTPDEEPSEVINDDNKLIEKIQEIINNGVKKIKNDVKSSQGVVQPEVWTSFNSGVDDFLQSVKKGNSLRQNANSTSILNQFQNFAQGFFGQLTGNQNSNASQDNPQQPGFPQNIASAFQNGLNQISSSLGSVFSGQNQPATVLGDTTSTSAPNPIQGFIQQAQSSINNLFNPQQQNQADQTSSSPNPIQSFSQSISSAIQGLNPFANRPGAAGDESSTQGNPFQAIQNAFNNLNPFASSTAKPSDSSSTSNPFPTIPSIPSNPLGNGSIPGVDQISQVISNSSGAFNPQGVVDQITNAIPNNPLQGGSNPLEGINQVIPNNPLQSGGGNPIEGVVQQIGGAIPNNPLNSGSNPIESAVQQVGNLVPNNPLQNGRK